MNPPLAGPTRPPRPTFVTVASWFQIAAAVILLLLVGLMVAGAVHFDGQIDRAASLVPNADPAEVASERSGNVVMTVIPAVLALLLAGWLGGCVVPVRRGSNTGRILVFVAGGVQLLLCFGQACAGALVIPLVIATAVGTGSPPPAEPPPGADGYVPWEQSEFARVLYSHPDPLSDLLSLVVGVEMLAVLVLSAAVVLLLAMPPANRFFVPRAAPALPTWPQPTPYGYLVPPGYMLVPYPGYRPVHPATAGPWVGPGAAAPPADAGAPAPTESGDSVTSRPDPPDRE